jgi:hypothetical protein
MVPAVTSRFDHEWRLIDEGQGQWDQKVQLNEKLWSSVFSIAGEKRVPVAGSGCLLVDPGDRELCVSGRGPSQRRASKPDRSQRRGEDLWQVSRRSELFSEQKRRKKLLRGKRNNPREGPDGWRRAFAWP